MNNFPHMSAVIFQIFISVLTLATSLIVTYFAFKLNQKSKSEKDTKLQIIKAATHDIQKYSEKIKHPKEDNDLLDYIIYHLPEKVNEVQSRINSLEAMKDKIYPKLKYFTGINICALLLETVFLYLINLDVILKMVIFSATSLILLSTIVSMARIIKPFVRDVRELRKKYKLFIDDLGKAKGASISITSITREKLTKLIKQRNKMGFGTSISSIKNELDLYGITVTESEIIRSSLNIFYPNLEERRQVLDIFYMDGKTHENFDELTDKEILGFMERVKINLETLKNQEKV